MNDRAIFAAIGEILAEQRGVTDKQIASVLDTIEDKVSDYEKLLEHSVSEKLAAIPAAKDGKDGKDGKDVDPTDVALCLLANEEHKNMITGPAGQPGTDGVSATAEDVADKILSSADFIASVKGADGADGIAGADGADGKPGAAGSDGADRYVLSPTHIERDTQVDKNTVVYWRGGLFQAVKKAHGCPDTDPGAYNPIVNGVAGVTGAYNKEERSHTLKCRLSDGEIFNVSIPGQPGLQAPEEGVKQLPGDYYFDGSLRKVFNGESWDSYDITGPSGKDGTDGKRGRKGLAGVGIEDIFADQDSVTFLLSNGESKSIDITKQNDPMPGEIRRFVGGWSAGNKYKRGDVVAHAGASYVAMADTASDPQNQRGKAWAAMSAASPAGASSLPTPLTNAITRQVVKGDQDTPLTALSHLVELRATSGTVDVELPDGVLGQVLILKAIGEQSAAYSLKGALDDRKDFTWLPEDGDSWTIVNLDGGWYTINKHSI